MTTSLSFEHEAKTHFLQGQAHQKAGNIEAAMQSYERAIYYGHTEAHMSLAFLCYAEQEDYETALLHLHAVQEVYPQSAYNLAFVYEKLSRLPEAVHYYKKAVKVGVAAAHIQLGYIYECCQEYNQALMQYQIALFKGEGQAHLLLGQLFEMLEEWDRAFDHYVAAAKTDFSPFLNRLAAHEIPGGRTQQQLQSYRQHFVEELQKGPFALGQVNQRQGDYAQAMTFYQKALDEGDERGAEGIASILSDFTNDAEKFQFLKESITANVVEAYYHLALYYQERADYPNALMAIKHYNKLSPQKSPKGTQLLNLIFDHM